MEEKTLVENINSGKRKKQRRDRNFKRKKYEDKDPHCLNFRKPCSHKEGSKFCCSSVTVQQVTKNRKRFYEKQTKVNQDIFLTRLISLYEPQRRGNYTPKANSQRQSRALSCTYYLYSYKKKKNVVVCRNMFLATFSIKKGRVNGIAKTVHEGCIPKEKRGGDRKSLKSIVKKNKVRDFLNKLPAKESHYNRMKSKRIYLSSELNIKKLTCLYNALATAESPELKVSRSMFYDIFSNEYNIGFSAPASDACNVCVLWTNKIKNEKDPSKKQLAMTEKTVHKLRANAFYEQMKNPPTNCKSYCFDLQQQQPLPKTPIQDAFYKRQISLYNFCIMPVNENGSPFLYIWDETQAGRGAVEIGSALYNFLCIHFPQECEENNINVIKLFCDGCGGQNKNCHIVHMLMFWLCRKAPRAIKSIILTYPVRGHSFLPADRVFGRIEKELRKKPVLTNKEDYIEIFAKHGTIRSLGKEWNLKDVKSLQTPLKKIERLQSLKKVFIQRKSGRNIDAEVKGMENYRFEATETFVSLLKKGKRFPLEIEDEEQRNCGLSAAKKKDVEDLLIKQFGDEWKTLPELVWYKNILTDNFNVYNDDNISGNCIHEDDACICLEPDIGEIRV